jgi:hypothetical protein
MWLRNKIDAFHFYGKKKKKIFNQNEPQNISFERVAEDNTSWVSCTNIHIVYWNIVFAFYNFPVPMVEE